MGIGELGRALDIKLINNVLFAANAQLVAAAVALGRQLDVAPDAFASVAAPFLRKDVAAAVSAVERIGADMGFLRSVVEKGPVAPGRRALTSWNVTHQELAIVDSAKEQFVCVDISDHIATVSLDRLRVNAFESGNDARNCLLI